jgi:hypothetical protein
MVENRQKCSTCGADSVANVTDAQSRLTIALYGVTVTGKKHRSLIEDGQVQGRPEFLVIHVSAERTRDGGATPGPARRWRGGNNPEERVERAPPRHNADVALPVDPLDDWRNARRRSFGGRSTCRSDAFRIAVEWSPNGKR